MPFNSMLLWLTQNTLKLVKVRKNFLQIGGFFASGSRFESSDGGECAWVLMACVKVRLWRSPLILAWNG
jgi:hypothetical protein